MKLAISGHRPERCDSEGGVRIRFNIVLKQAQPDVVFYGGCQGVDLWAADEAVELGIPIVFAKPWADHIDTVPKEHQELYERLEAASKSVVIINEGKVTDKTLAFKNRNEALVDHATHLCAYWDGGKSGTMHTWNYAEGKIPRRNIYDWPPF